MLSPSFVGRRDALESVQNVWSPLIEGTPAMVIVEAEPGMGRRAFTSRLAETLVKDSESLFPIHVEFSEGEDSLKVLLRLYASLYVSLHDNDDLRAKVIESLKEGNEKRSDAQKQWVAAFLEGLEKEKPDLTSTSFPVTIPRHSPYLGLIELLAILSATSPILFDLGDVDNILSFSFWTFLSALLARIQADALPILVVLRGRPQEVRDDPKGILNPRNALIKNLPKEFTHVSINLAPLTVEETQELIDSSLAPHRFPSELAQRVHALAHGSPLWTEGILNGLIENERIVKADDDSWLLQGDAASIDLETALPPIELDNAAQVRQMLRIAALEGEDFTAKLIAEQLDVERDIVDDALDELESMIAELTYHQGLESWIYRFKSPFLRAAYAADLTETARAELARGIAGLMEKGYVGRSADYAFKAAQLWRIAGEPKRASSLMGLAASSERPDLLQMGVDIVRAHPNTEFPPAIYKGLYLTLLEKISGSAPVEPLLLMVQDVEKWAQAHDEKDLEPWIALHRARLFNRARDLKAAESAAKRARKGFARVGNKVKEGEAFNVMAQIALAGGEPGVALEHISRALTVTEFPPVKAQAIFMRGIVHKSRGELQQALDTFKEALELAGATGQTALYLDAGLNIADALLLGGKPGDALHLLGQLLDIAKKTQNPHRARQALVLMGRAEAAGRNHEKAAQYVSQALHISREMKSKAGEAADLLDLGMYNLAAGKGDEAAVFLRESEKLAKELNDPRLRREVAFNMALVATTQKDFEKALQRYQEALILAREHGDKRREANILFNMGSVYSHLNQLDRARTYLDQARPLIEAHGSPDEKKALTKAREQLALKLN